MQGSACLSDPSLLAFNASACPGLLSLLDAGSSDASVDGNSSSGTSSAGSSEGALCDLACAQGLGEVSAGGHHPLPSSNH